MVSEKLDPEEPPNPVPENELDPEEPPNADPNKEPDPEELPNPDPEEEPLDPEEKSLPWFTKVVVTGAMNSCLTELDADPRVPVVTTVSLL